jgi:hypothetical protein
MWARGIVVVVALAAGLALVIPAVLITALLLVGSIFALLLIVVGTFRALDWFDRSRRTQMLYVPAGKQIDRTPPQRPADPWVQRSDF